MTTFCSKCTITRIAKIDYWELYFTIIAGLPLDDRGKGLGIQAGAADKSAINLLL